MTPHPHGDLIDDYLAHLRARRCTRRTIGTYGETLHTAHAALPMGVPLATRDEIETWLGSGDWSSATIGLRLTVLRGFFAWAVRTGHLDRDSTDHVAKPRTVRRHVPPATTEQVRAIIARTSGVTWLASLVAAHAGLRAIEIARLRREYVTVEAIDVREGKGGHQRQVPTHPLVWRAVADLPAGPLIGTSERLLTSRCWRAYRRVGVETSLHRLRKWFATELLRGGADLNTIRLLLGHRSLATTQLYLGVDPEAMTTAVASLPVLSPAAADDPDRTARP